MLEWIISSSVLIAVVILLRLILKGKISLRLQYALWALVLVRLLLPFSIGNSNLSIMNPVEQSQVYQEMMGPVTNLPSTAVPDLSTGGQVIPVVPNTGMLPGSAGQNASSVQEPNAQKDIYTVQRVDWQGVLCTVWVSGIALFGTWFLVTNLLFAFRVRKSRRALQAEQRIPVYKCDRVDTPCLFGMFHPAIYLTNEAAADDRTMRHAVEHELTHYRHGDHIWSVLRCICLALHWYNPLVWWAAILSKNDAELACDESTIRRLGESERAEYGRTLLRLTCEKRPALLNTATTMTGSARTIKERIALIVKKPKMAVYTLIAVVLVAAIAVGCTFTGANDTPDTDDGGQTTEENGGYSEDTGDHGETEVYPTPDIPEEQLAQLDPAVIEYAVEYVQREIAHQNQCGAEAVAGVYSIIEARITNIELIPTGAEELTDGTALYRLEFRLLADHPEHIMLAGGMTMDGDWLTEWGSTGQPYLLMHCEEIDGETVWTRICVTHTDNIMVDYGTPEMLERYGDPYLAASIELYQNYLQEKELGKVATLPVLELTDAEMDAACTAVMIDLKSGWWKGGKLVDCTYEASAFECVYRETESYVERFYGYAGYFRFDESGNCVEYWYAPAIVTLDVYTKQYYNVWWPGDGAYYESDILARFPDEIAAFVAEPNEERYQVIRDRLLTIAKGRMIPETSQDIINRLSLLTAEDIKHTAGFCDVDKAELASLIGAATVNRIDRIENLGGFWSLELYLSGGPDSYNTATDEWLVIYAGQEENIVQILYHGEDGLFGEMYCEDEALYRFVRGAYATEEYVDEAAFARFGDILSERAQKTVDRSEENVNEFYPLPYNGYEIVYLKLVETFEKDGAMYEVYEWDVAFLHNNPIVTLAGGMWIDSELRVRSLEQETYFVTRTSGDLVDYQFFFYDLYFGPDEETGRFNAHETILKRFNEEA